MAKWIDMTGQRFGLLVAKSYLGNSRWLCLCDCGGEATPSTSNLRSGNSESCGCRKREVLGESTTKHGQSNSRTYRIWAAVKTRCLNPNTPRYKDYGGRGVTLCEHWHKFENFLADMGECPDGMAIDRIDNNKGYEPGNCRWITYAENNLNKRNTVLVDGVPLKTLADQHGVSYLKLYKRLQKGKPLFD